ncbi:MAG: hypothetical protein WC635_13550 [Bacteriovorax sp.]|jgi:hypothetical protein
MKKLLAITLVTILASSSAFSAVVKSYDTEKNCDLYTVVQPDEKGKIKLKPTEVITYSKDVYGLSFQEMEINFENREVLVMPIMNVVFGINRPLTATKTSISADNEEFNFLINQLNRKLYVFEKVCIGDNKIVYAKMFETEAEKRK